MNLLILVNLGAASWLLCAGRIVRGQYVQLGETVIITTPLLVGKGLNTDYYRQHSRGSLLTVTVTVTVASYPGQLATKQFS